MMNYILPTMFLVSFICAALTGRMAELSSSVIEGAVSATELLMNLLSMLCLWGGVMEIAEKSGVTALFSKLTAPVMRLIFPSLKKEKYALEAISMNVAANVLGIGNAATPLGIEAMKRLQSLNPDTSRASDEMVIFVVMNTAAMRIIPTNVALLRSRAGSEEPMSILLPTVAATFCAMAFAIIAAKISCRIKRKGRKEKCSQK